MHLSLSDQAIAHGSGKLESDDVRQMLGTVSRTKVLDLLDALIADDARQALTVLDAIASHSPGLQRGHWMNSRRCCI